MTVVDEPSRQVVRRLQERAPETVVAQVADLRRQIEQLQVAVETNRVIGAAVGILMERLQLDRAAAFDQLTRLSQHANIRLGLIAEGLVGEAETACAASSPGPESSPSVGPPTTLGRRVELLQSPSPWSPSARGNGD